MSLSILTASWPGVFFSVSRMGKILVADARNAYNIEFAKPMAWRSSLPWCTSLFSCVAGVSAWVVPCGLPLELQQPHMRDGLAGLVFLSQTLFLDKRFRQDAVTSSHVPTRKRVVLTLSASDSVSASDMRGKSRDERCRVLLVSDRTQLCTLSWPELVLARRAEPVNKYV